MLFRHGWDLNCVKTRSKGGSSAPWVNRGGNYNNGTNAGVFNFNRTNAGGWTNNSFRSVLSLTLWVRGSKKIFFQNTKPEVYD